jgi:serine/threonine protein phosphatase PrpC
MIRRTLRIQDAGATHVGKVRGVNEDAILLRSREGLWAVADGMGGHAHGQWASQAIVAALEEADGDDFDAHVAAAAAALHDANARIWAEGEARGESMGSTVAALLVHGTRFAVFWAGDSRCYLLRDKTIHRLTTDHSQVQEMVEAGQLTPDEAEDHPMAHVLSRAVGVRPELELDAVADEARAGDVFLLCSDGLTRLVSDDELAEWLGASSPAAIAEHLVTISLARGAPDNVSVVVVDCDETTLLAFGPQAIGEAQP